MARYYLGCMHEQYHPAELLQQAVAGEQAGFDGIACSDHFQPWWEPGHSGHAWIWLGAAAEATERVPVGPAVTVGLKRYHPALIAQGFATLEAMYPRRVFVGLGSGESLNESPFGLEWPAPREQLAALEEACVLIRRLWDGERVDHEGRFFTARRAYLHTRPEQPPPLWVSAFRPGSAKVAGRHGDGLWTMADPDTAPDLIDTYRGAAEDAGRASGVVVFEAGFSWAPNDDEALESARGWKGAVPGDHFIDDWFDPQKMYERGEQTVSDDDLKEQFLISSDPDEHAERIREMENLAGDGDVIVKLSNFSGPNALEAIRVYGERVLPKLRSA